MPVTEGFNNDRTLYGFEAAFWATMAMGDSFKAFVGGLSNFIFLLILLFRVIIALKKDTTPTFITSSITQFLSSIFASISVGIWFIIWSQPLFFGYYIWAISILIMCWTNLLQQRLQKALYDKAPKDSPTGDHLLETL